MPCPTTSKPKPRTSAHIFNKVRPILHYPLRPSQDSEDSDSGSASSMSSGVTMSLRTTIAAAPEGQLREIMIRLVEQYPGFHQAIAKELLPPPSVPAIGSTTLSPRGLQMRRRYSRRVGGMGSKAYLHPRCVRCGKQKRSQVTDGKETPMTCVHHTGKLEEETYEFISRTPEGLFAPPVCQRIAMWSCCDEDAWSPGCASVSRHAYPEDSLDVVGLENQVTRHSDSSSEAPSLPRLSSRQMLKNAVL